MNRAKAVRLIKERWANNYVYNPKLAKWHWFIRLLGKRIIQRGKTIDMIRWRIYRRF